MADVEDDIQEFNQKMDDLREEIGKGLVGQDDVVNGVLTCLMCRGHVLLEGVPGLAKTLLVRLMSTIITDASFNRIQFTPDLLPSDIVGTTIYEEESGEFRVRKGPIFANFVLADEINRASPKVQSAMLQAMQEREVTIGKETFDLPEPFMVLATQNPLEQAGTYPLSAAQIDRFLFKIYVDYPGISEEVDIIDQNVEVSDLEEFETEQIIDLDDLQRAQETVKKVQISEELKEYILNISWASREPEEHGIDAGRFIANGASSRASIFTAYAGRANALMEGRNYVTPEDVRQVAPHVLRHRIQLNYEGKSRDITADDIVNEIVDTVPVV